MLQILGFRGYWTCDVHPDPGLPTIDVRRTKSVLRLSLVLATAAALTLLSASEVAAAFLQSSGPLNHMASAPPRFINCTVCHSDRAINTGTGSVSIQGVPNEYVFGATYPITVSVEMQGQSRWGFELTVTDQEGQFFGSLTPTSALVQESSGYIKHAAGGTHDGVLDGPVSWTFHWTAPRGTRTTGRAFFYASGNAADFNSEPFQDFIYSDATASAPARLPHEDASLVLQADSGFPPRGRDWYVNARVRNHRGASDNLVLVSRVRISPGVYVPAMGYLQAPIVVQLAPLEKASFRWTHHIPANAPFITATYEAFLGRLPGILVDQDSFTFEIFP